MNEFEQEKKALGEEFIEEAFTMIKFKEGLLGTSFLRYLMRAIMAGILITFGYIMYITVDSNFSTMALQNGTDLKPLGHFISSWLFGFCLVFIYFVKAELLTSNMMILSVGQYYNQISFRKMFKVLFYCFLGNFLGGVFVSLLIANSTVVTSEVSVEYMKHVLEVKQGYVTSMSGMADLLVRAVWCNFFINLAMLVVYSGKVKENGAKILLMLVGVFFFMYLGFEHSVANTLFFTLAGFIQFFNPAIELGFSFGEASLNVIIVLIGNFIGGGILIGYYYAYLMDKRK